MEIKEQIAEMLTSIIESSKEPVFSEDEYNAFRECGFSEERIAKLERTERLTQIIQLLPSDKEGIKRMYAALSAISKPNSEENVANLRLIAEKDPQMLTQLLALTSFAEYEAEAREEVKK